MNNLNMMCAIGGTGYGITSLNIVKALTELNVSISLFPIGSSFSVNSDNDKKIIQQCINNTSNFDYTAPTLKIWHQNDLAIKPGKGRYATFPFFEVDKLKPIEKHHLNFSDIIFVASKWAKNILINNGITRPIEVAPLAVDMQIFYDPIKIKVENPKYTFFHIGKWEKRKGQDFLIEAFSKAFSPADNVSLALLPHNPFLTEDEKKYWLNLVNESPMKDNILIFNRLDTQYDLANFIFHGDCAIFMSRAEGWNNEIVECMAMNKPIITTNYSAHTEYCNNDNSYLVNIDELEPAIDSKWFDGTGNWAKLGTNQMDQTVELMRYVYNNNIRTNPNGISTAKHYSWSNTANLIKDHLFNTRNSNANTRKKRKRR
jgi:glycosyltransferase involved in cell wall biosynthesis